MKRKELTKAFMMVSKWKKTFGLHGLYKHIQRLNTEQVGTLVLKYESASKSRGYKVLTWEKSKSFFPESNKCMCTDTTPHINQHIRLQTNATQ